jgi:1-phosphofructokinase
MRIVTLTLHPAIDRVLNIRELKAGDTFDAQLALSVPAGKGVNTARSLSCLRFGKRTGIVAAAWLGEGESGWFSERLENSSGIRAAICTRPCFTRYAYTILEKSGRETHIKEFMPAVTPAEEKQLLSFWRRTLRRGDLVAFCGSAPKNFSETAAGSVFQTARKEASIVIADTNGMLLDAAGRMNLDGIKGNALEIGQWLGLEDSLHIEMKSHRAALRAAFRREGSPQLILVTLGATGAALATEKELFFAGAPRLPKNLGKSATGCGDAATAGWLWALNEGRSPGEQLARAVACGSAKFASADPGALDQKFVRKLLREIRVETVAGY